MKKIIKIDGMTCNHCHESIEKALNAVNGVHAKVDIRRKEAFVDMEENVDDHELTNAVKDAGYEVISIKENRLL